MTETRPTYYAKDGTVWKRSIKTRDDDSSTHFTIGFPVCTMSDACSQQAESVAGLMNQGEVAPELAEALEKATARLIEHANEIGPCDHEVNLCVCDLWREIEEFQALAAKALEEET